MWRKPGRRFAAGNPRSLWIRASLPSWTKADSSKSCMRVSRQQTRATVFSDKVFETMRLRLRCWALALMIFPSVLCSTAVGQDRPLKKITWGMTALTASMWIPWLAKEAKIYEKNGLDVEIILLRGSGQSSQALLGGSLFAAPVALPQVMLANLNGADLVNVAHTIAAANSKLLANPAI